MVYARSMSMISLARSERTELCDLMLDLGPDAPTVPDGWKVLDLAAHLVVRERDVWAAPGIVLGGPFKAMLEAAMRRRRRHGLEDLVDTIRAGPPRWWKYLPAGAQLSEYYIHHEDVRRANGHHPRTGTRDLDDGLARLLTAMAPRILRTVEAGVELTWHRGVLYRHGSEPRAILEGPPGELLLYLTGRRQVAEVGMGGDETARDVLECSDLRL